MPPTNDTGFTVSVGPDVDGNYFDVEPGDTYKLPEPPRTVSDEEAEAPAEETPAEAPSVPPRSAKAHKQKDPTPPDASVGSNEEATPPAPADTEGTQA